MDEMAIQSRQTTSTTGSSTRDEFLDLISDPFQAQIQANSIYASIVWAFAVSSGLFVAFCLLRPRNSAVYAPRAKYSDEKHAPPPLSKNLLSWFQSIRKVEEHILMEKIGLDAVVFLRFLRMLRNIFLVFSVLGCAVLIPVNLAGGHYVYSNWGTVATLMKFTPQYIFGKKFWAFVVMAYIFQFIVFGFIWSNYRAVLRLRMAYFKSWDYRSSLHSRTLLVTHVPEGARTDTGIATLVEEAKPTEDIPTTVVGRSMRELPQLLEEHDKTVKKLESYLAAYLANPEELPEKRPMMKPFKKDSGFYQETTVDAIDYLTARMRKLEAEIHESRAALGSREPEPYGFASYSHIEDAHAVAYAARKKTPQGCEIRLAPKPHDLIWQNLSMSRATRNSRRFWDSFAMVLLTLAYIPLNIVTAVFLSDFSHLGLLWHGFQKSLEAHPVGWGIAQGIIAPTVQTAFFFFLPSIFRRLYSHSGDVSKTSRERHVTSRLFAFFVVNNLVVFSIFGSAFRFVAAVIEAKNLSVWQAINHAHPFTNVMAGLCNVSTFWLTYQMQQNLSAATDLAQLWPLAWSFVRRRLDKLGWWPLTLREKVELSAPQPLDYASYYNTYLFLATVGFCFGTLQPIVLPTTAFYLFIEVFFKRYLVQYVLFTKTESGGVCWRMLTNRLLFAILLSNGVIALIVGAQGVGVHDLIQDMAANAAMLYTMIPLPFLVWAFKWCLARNFDDKMRFSSTKALCDMDSAELEAVEVQTESGKRNDKVAVRFGHPALYKKLLAPIVAANSQHLLKGIQSDLRTGSVDRGAVFGYSDVYLTDLDASKPGKASQDPSTQGFELVQESDLDFENFKRRAEFAEQFGGEGELYGRAEDLTVGSPSRSGTPSTFTTFGEGQQMRRKPLAIVAAGDGSTRGSSRMRVGESESGSSPLRRDPEDTEGQGTTYGAGYMPALSQVRSLSDDHSVERDQPSRLDSVDLELPTPGLGTEDIMAAGRHDAAYQNPDDDDRGRRSESAGRLLSDVQKPKISPRET